MSKFSTYAESRDGALYEVVSSDRYAISRRLTPEVIDSQLTSAGRNITRRLRSLGIMYTINFINPTERDFYDISDAFIKAIELAESNDVRVRQDFISIKNKYDALTAKMDKYENENAKLKEEIRSLQKVLDAEREDHKMELRNATKAVLNSEYKAQASEKLRFVAEKQSEKLQNMLQNSRTLSITKSYGAPMHSSQCLGASTANSMSRSLAKSMPRRPMSAGRRQSDFGPARPRSAIMSPGGAAMESSRLDRYNSYRHDDFYAGNTNQSNNYDDSLKPMSDRMRSSYVLRDGDSFASYDPASMVRDSHLYSESLHPYQSQSLKPPKCPSLRETEVHAQGHMHPDYALSSAHTTQSQYGSRSTAQSPGNVNVRAQYGYDQRNRAEDDLMKTGYMHPDMLQHTGTGSSFLQSPPEPTLMSVGELLEKHNSGVFTTRSSLANTGGPHSRPSANYAPQQKQPIDSHRSNDDGLDAKKEQLEKMQTQIAEAVNILNRAGIMVDVSKRDTRGLQ